MPNMPSITPAEIAVVGIAALVLYVVPFVLARIGERRRRRLPVWSRTVAVTEAPDQPAAATPTLDLPSVPATAAAQRCDPHGASPEEPASPAYEDGSTAAMTETPELAAPAAAGQCTSNIPQLLTASATATPFGDDTGGPAFEPFAGDAGYQFRLEDLHRVRFPEWADAARSHLWRDAERVAEMHGTAISASMLLSPYPIRSACRSGVELEHSTLRLRYLLFPALWPTSRDQAVAQATFEVDLQTGALHPRVDALRRCDLSDDARLAIRDSGGDV
jgi:hypothetical protein